MQLHLKVIMPINSPIFETIIEVSNEDVFWDDENDTVRERIEREVERLDEEGYSIDCGGSEDTDEYIVLGGPDGAAATPADALDIFVRLARAIDDAPEGK